MTVRYNIPEVDAEFWWDEVERKRKRKKKRKRRRERRLAIRLLGTVCERLEGGGTQLDLASNAELAGWWKEHKAGFMALREQKEKKARKKVKRANKKKAKAALKKQALAKLTPKERKVIGVGT